ncbi:helix-turn-helix domain-containing protein [Novosphingobium sp. P6W]|uniref:helix-turn-helix domain-containing protein n=1 Tax=Novosphingobium sp. P6W TaxID=1609758 RepID=UPI0009E46389|nr:helix-turn-helix domain-containing protein [Novosphingobium sp. P6W]AXB80469.1 helix-turn-helix domain-containing protein [Novosphingobium sp. P6W]
MSKPSIPSFVLYGEKLGDDVPEFAHIETIAARSALYDWEIAPHRHLRSVQALLLSSGQVKFRCDGLVLDLRAPCYMIVPIGSVHGFQFSPETAGHVLTLSAGFISRALGPHDPFLHLLTYGARGTVPDTNLARVSWLCREMLDCQADWQAPQPLFMVLAEALVRSLPSPEQAEAADEERLVAFRRLVEIHLCEHRSVAWYAERLAITAKTLTRICRRSLDCTPTELVHSRLVLEARRLLSFTNATVSQVANELGFSDASYFSRFYRRMTGSRPAADKVQH